ncbi:MAG: RNA 2'-phosphotransferase [Anaerolineae bacterium]
MSDLVPLSKFLALILRHKADEFGLTLDVDGFTDVDSVWKQINTRFPGRYSYEDLLKVVEGDGDGKKRYEIVDGRIRALFGHSEGVREITYAPAVPPELLYHGTSQSALAIIRKEGLKAMRRQYVHFTVNTQRASKVASRHSDETVILTIRAGDAHRAGIVFYHPEEEHYLCEVLPPAFIEFPDA